MAVVHRAGWLTGPETVMLPKQTVGALIEAAGIEEWERPLVRIQVNGQPADHDKDLSVDDHVLIYRMPSGGSDSGKAIFGMIAAIGIALIAPGVGAALGKAIGLGSSELAAYAGRALFMVGASVTMGLIQNALIKPPPQQHLEQSTMPDSSPFFSFSGASNKYSPWGPVPRVYGTMRVYPRLLSQPLTEISDGIQYLVLLLDFGPGPLQLADMRIGETSIDTYENAEIVVHDNYSAGDNLSFFGAQNQAFSVGSVLDSAGTIQTTPLETSEVALDIAFPQGLYSINTQTGGSNPETVEIGIGIKRSNEADFKPLSDYATYTVSSPEVETDLYAVVKLTDWKEDENIWFVGFRNNVTYLGFETFFEPSPGDRFRVVSQGAYSTLDVTGVVGENINFGTNSWTFDFVLDEVLPEWVYQVRSTKPPTQVSNNIAIYPVNYDIIALEDNNNSSFVMAFSLLFNEPGEYDIEVRGLSGDPPQYHYNQAIWQQYTAFSGGGADIFRPAIPHTVVELKLQATGELSGTVENFSAIATSILPVHSDGVWSDQPTRNPAWIFCDILMGASTKHPVALDRIELDEIVSWANECDQLVAGEPLYECNLLIEGISTVKETLRTVASTGRASPTRRDHRFSVIRESQSPAPTQLITPKNTSAFSSELGFVTPPHGLKVTFIDQDLGYQPGEVLVYNNGYNQSNATVFETLNLPGVTRYAQATRLGRYFLAAGILRRERINCSMDVENLVCQRGDMVMVAHEVIRAGGLPRRVIGVNGQYAKLDEAVPGTDTIRIAGTETLITAIQHEPDVLEMPAGVTVQKGDLLEWGASETIRAPFIVEEVVPGPDLTAKLRLVEQRPEIEDAVNGTIPDRVIYPGATEEYVIGPARNFALSRNASSVPEHESWSLSWLPPLEGKPSYYTVYQVDQLGRKLWLGRTTETAYDLGRRNVSRAVGMFFFVVPVLDRIAEGEPVTISVSVT